jgi:hypothetical protein
VTRASVATSLGDSILQIAATVSCMFALSVLETPA